MLVHLEHLPGVGMRSWFVLLVLALEVVALVVGPPIVRVVIAGCMLLAPGWLLWSTLGKAVRLPPLAHIGVSIGLSISVIPLCFLWLNMLGLAVPPVALRLGLGILSGIAVWRIVYRPPTTTPRGHPRPPEPRRRSNQQISSFLPFVVRERLRAPVWLLAGLGFITLLTFGLRLYQIRGIVLPLWVDSVHHALLIRIVGETGRIPTSLQPYVEVDRLVYHWGYHVIAATWRSLTNLPIPVLMLLSGQLTSALHVLSVYTLGAYLTRSPLGGLFAGLITGLLSLMPAYYVTWGRYTQLTGLLMLPALLVLSCTLVEQPRLRVGTLAVAALTLAGLIVIHYRVLVFYAAFMLPWSVLFALARPRRLPNAIARLAALAVLGLLFAAPWVYEIAQTVLIPLAEQPAQLAGSDSYNGLDRTLLWTTNTYGIFAVAGCGLALALFQRHWRVIAVAGWVAAMVLLANPGIIGLPPSWFINNHSVSITLFLPISILAAFGARQIVALMAYCTPKRRQWVLGGLVACAIVGLAVRGVWQFRDVVNQSTNFATTADLPALAWASEHTPSDARFLINAAPWLNQAYRGTDAGWWLLPLTGRWTSTPPSIYDYGSPAYVAEVAERSAQVASLQASEERKVDEIVRRNGITHIFIGAKGGPLKPDMFWGRPEYEAVYDQEGVTIFAVRP